MIDEVITNNPSATTTATSPTTDVVVEKTGSGDVFLELKTPNGGWLPITSQTGAFVVPTPDTTIEYRFRPSDLSGEARVYFGP